MVEYVVDGGVESKSAIIEASGEASVDVKPTVDVKVKVKIPFQTHIEEKPKLSNVATLRSYEVNNASFCFNKGKMTRAK